MLPQKASNLARLAVKRGKLKVGVCEVCGSTDVHGHHDDYSKPLEVRWLCPKHHRQWHAEHGHAAGWTPPPKAVYDPSLDYETPTVTAEMMHELRLSLGLVTDESTYNRSRQDEVDQLRAWEQMLAHRGSTLADELASAVDAMGWSVAAATLRVPELWLRRWVRGTRPTLPPSGGQGGAA